jgi:molecular chaperone GrpE
MPAAATSRRSGENDTDMHNNGADPLPERADTDERPSGQDNDTEATQRPEAADAAGGPEASADDALAAAQEELARHREAMLRMQAEMENLRKRMLRDAEKSRRFALERIMKDLLQVRDSMERGLEMADASATVESLIEGEKLTYRMLVKLMEDHGLEVIDPVGEPFDPELHEAMTVMPAPDAAENTVLEVLQKGFKLHERLIRPARVIVAGKP